MNDLKEKFRKTMDMPPISVAITTYNRSDLIAACMVNIITHPLVDEIVVCDDCSTEKEFFETEKIIRNLDAIYPGRLRLIKNQDNLGSFFNKIRAVQNCKNDWVILLDSDNILTNDYLDALPVEPKARIVYCPSIAFPNFNYQKYYTRELFDRENISATLAKNSWLPTFLNTGNFFFNKNMFLNAVRGATEKCWGSCSIYLNYLFLKSGMRLYIVPGMHYYHRSHDGSYWIQTAEESMKFAAKLIEEMKTWK